MPQHDPLAQGRPTSPPSSDSGETYHGFLLSRSPHPAPPRRKKGPAETRSSRLARLVAGLATFSGGGLVGSGITLMAQGRASLGPPGVLLAAGLSTALAGLLIRQLASPRLAGPTPAAA